MSANIPYLASPGSVTSGLNKILSASTPEKVTGDFVNSKLGIKGGTGRALVPFLKKIGLVGSDGVPTILYKQFRNDLHSKSAIASAIKKGYADLYEINEYTHELSNAELKGVIVQATGLEKDSSVIPLMVSTLNKLKAFADFDGDAINIIEDTNNIEEQTNAAPHIPQQIHLTSKNSLGMNLSYTINLNLPATSDIAVFNAIFKSLKENLLNDE